MTAVNTCWLNEGCVSCGAAAGVPCDEDCPDGPRDEWCCHDCIVGSH